MKDYSPLKLDNGGKKLYRIGKKLKKQAHSGLKQTQGNLGGECPFKTQDILHTFGEKIGEDKFQKSERSYMEKKI